MRRQPTRERLGQEGYALLTVMVFVVVIIVAGAAFFSMASYETRQALQREASSEAFYLADGAVERVRAKLLEDRSWRDGWSEVSTGRGAYTVTLEDTTYQGQDNVVRIMSQAEVERGRRAVEVFAQVPPTAFDMGILVMGSLVVGGNLCLSGPAHVNGEADFGPGDAHLQCGGTYTAGFTITPPPVYTEPDSFPDATYYFVRGDKAGSLYHGRIFDRQGVDITTSLEDSLTDVISYNPGQHVYSYVFDKATEITHYFDDTSGIFRRLSGDRAVVVNFGETPLFDPDAVTDLDFDKGGAFHPTVINTRFIGFTEADRLDSDCWQGGELFVRKITWEPYYGIASISGDFQKPGGSLVVIGTETWPALVYVTRDVTNLNANFELTGAIICLGDWTSTGGPDFVFHAGFVPQLPGCLINDWPSGVSGTLKILRWREVAWSGE